MEKLIRVSAVVVRDEGGRVLTVRKRGTGRFMLPGGKPEAGESAARTALREFEEELGIALDPALLRPLGRFRSAAANEAGFELESTVFTHPPVPVAGPAAEIEELRWLDPAVPLPADLAPMLEHHVLPALAAAVAELPGRVALYTGSSPGARPEYAARVVQLASELARLGIGVVYGGGHVGLMGVAADAALAAGGEVHGVITQALADREISHIGLTRLDVVPDMHERKDRMAQLADAFVALPGGAGTLEEFFEMWTWQHLGIHHKPVALYDVDGFWDPLIAMLDRMVAEGFLKEASRSGLIVARTPEELIAAWREWAPPAGKWGAEAVAP